MTNSGAAAIVASRLGDFRGEIVYVRRININALLMLAPVSAWATSPPC